MRALDISPLLCLCNAECKNDKKNLKKNCLKYTIDSSPLQLTLKYRYTKHLLAISLQITLHLTINFKRNESLVLYNSSYL